MKFLVLFLCLGLLMSIPEISFCESSDSLKIVKGMPSDLKSLPWNSGSFSLAGSDYFNTPRYSWDHRGFEINKSGIFISETSNHTKKEDKSKTTIFRMSRNYKFEESASVPGIFIDMQTVDGTLLVITSEGFFISNIPKFRFVKSQDDLTTKGLPVSAINGEVIYLFEGRLIRIVNVSIKDSKCVIRREVLSLLQIPDAKCVAANQFGCVFFDSKQNSWNYMDFNTKKTQKLPNQLASRKFPASYSERFKGFCAFPLPLGGGCLVTINNEEEVRPITGVWKLGESRYKTIDTLGGYYSLFEYNSMHWIENRQRTLARNFYFDESNNTIYFSNIASQVSLNLDDLKAEIVSDIPSTVFKSVVVEEGKLFSLLSTRTMTVKDLVSGSTYVRANLLSDRGQSLYIDDRRLLISGPPSLSGGLITVLNDKFELVGSYEVGMDYCAFSYDSKSEKIVILNHNLSEQRISIQLLSLDTFSFVKVFELDLCRFLSKNLQFRVRFVDTYDGEIILNLLGCNPRGRGNIIEDVPVLIQYKDEKVVKMPSVFSSRFVSHKAICMGGYLAVCPMTNTFDAWLYSGKNRRVINNGYESLRDYVAGERLDITFFTNDRIIGINREQGDTALIGSLTSKHTSVQYIAARESTFWLFSTKRRIAEDWHGRSVIKFIQFDKGKQVKSRICKRAYENAFVNSNGQLCVPARHMYGIYILPWDGSGF